MLTIELSWLAEGDKLLNEGQDLAEVRRHLAIAESTWHRWKSQYGGIKANDAKRLKNRTLLTKLGSASRSRRFTLTTNRAR
jgi:hypothetical protein